ncbi:hypothetical protein HK098_005264 [Nowakowskiella sp. JEL0407]|nr:hypothetical protein HK098_005264 [Nowakowskiella sp. JEL0407]
MNDTFSLLPSLDKSFEPLYPGLNISDEQISTTSKDKIDNVNETTEIENNPPEDMSDYVSLAALQATLERRSRLKSNHSENSNSTQLNPPLTSNKPIPGESSTPSRSNTILSRPTNKSVSTTGSAESVNTLSDKFIHIGSVSTDSKSEEFTEGFKIEPMRPNAKSKKTSKKSKERRYVPPNMSNLLTRASSSRSAPEYDSFLKTNDLEVSADGDFDGDGKFHTAYSMKRYEGGGVIMTDHIAVADSTATQPVNVFVKGGYKVSANFLQKEDPEDTLRCDIIKEQRFFGIRLKRETLLVVRYGVMYLYAGKGKRCQQIDLRTTKVVNNSPKDNKVSIFTPSEGEITLNMQKPELSNQLVDIINKFSVTANSRPTSSTDLSGPQSADVLSPEENDLTYEKTRAKNSRRVKSVDLTRFKSVSGRSDRSGRKFWF